MKVTAQRRVTVVIELEDLEADDLHKALVTILESNFAIHLERNHLNVLSKLNSGIATEARNI